MSNYSGTAPVGDPKATGAYAVAIAAQAGGTNNDGHATDSAGNLAIDYVWGGQLPLQPNDERRATAVNIGGTNGSDAFAANANGEMRGVPGKGADAYWAATTAVTGTNLSYGPISAYSGSNALANRNVPADNHVRAESGWVGFPSFASTHQGVYIITQASGNGSTQYYTSPNNFLKAGDTVNITGTGLDGTNLTVATANRYTFTVSGSGTGNYINISGRVHFVDEVTTNDGAYVAGVDYVLVPNVLGITTALAVDAMTDAELVQTTASAATNTPVTITAASRTSGDATISMTAASNGFSAGQKVVITAVDATVNGTYTVDPRTTSGTLVVVGTATTSLALTGLTGSVAGVSGTIKSQSVAAGAASIAAGTAVTITPWA
jgi:hypothetical protein